MSVLVAIDPGLRGCGWSNFVDGRFSACGYARNPEKTERGPVAWFQMALAVKSAAHAFPSEVVIEMPVVRRQRLQKGDQEDITELVGVVASIFMPYHRIVKRIIYKPEEWGGTVPKAIKNERVIKLLGEARFDAFSPDIRHNVLDSAGIGLYHLGQFEGGSAYARVRATASTGSLTDGRALITRSRTTKPKQPSRKLKASRGLSEGPATVLD